MGYWPKRLKRKRHSWVENLGRKLVLIGCTGHYEIWSQVGRPLIKRYVLDRPGFEGERAWEADFTLVQCKGFSKDSATIKGARMMEILP